MLGVGRHMLDYAWLSTLYLVYAVVVVGSARVDILGLIDRGGQIRLCGLLGEVRPRNLDLQARLVWSGRYDVKIL